MSIDGINFNQNVEQPGHTDPPKATTSELISVFKNQLKPGNKTINMTEARDKFISDAKECENALKELNVLSEYQDISQLKSNGYKMCGTSPQGGVYLKNKSGTFVYTQKTNSGTKNIYANENARCEINFDSNGKPTNGTVCIPQENGNYKWIEFKYDENGNMHICERKEDPYPLEIPPMKKI